MSNSHSPIPFVSEGNKVEIENYRPIANLCSASKIFEKLIPKQIQYLENKNKLDLTNKKANMDLNPKKVLPPIQKYTIYYRSCC